jgi:hypothetical protein
MKTIFGYIICSLAAVVFCAVIFTSIAQPTPGNYPDTSLPLSTDTTVTTQSPHLSQPEELYEKTTK